MNTERLLRLADYMAGVNPKNYNQDSWADGLTANIVRWAEDFEFDHGRVIIPEGACGTTMCVMGHAVAAVPDAKMWFRTNCRSGPIWVTISYRDPSTGLIHEGYDAARAAFDLPENHAEIIFGAADEPLTYTLYTGLAYDDGELDDFHHWVSPQTVAAKLREYVASQGKLVEDVIEAVKESENAQAD